VNRQNRQAKEKSMDSIRFDERQLDEALHILSGYYGGDDSAPSDGWIEDLKAILHFSATGNETIRQDLFDFMEPWRARSGQPGQRPSQPPLGRALGSA
jgi:hypothetical protein